LNELGLGENGKSQYVVFDRSWYGTRCCGGKLSLNHL